jgi:hypothetical protein
VSWACSGLTLSQPTDVHPNDSTQVDDKHRLSSDAIILAYLMQLVIFRDGVIEQRIGEMSCVLVGVLAHDGFNFKTLFLTAAVINTVGVKEEASPRSISVTSAILG